MINKKCEVCESSCQPLVTPVMLNKSEWYCKNCHKSYYMKIDDAKMVLAYEKQVMGSR